MIINSAPLLEQHLPPSRYWSASFEFWRPDLRTDLKPIAPDVKTRESTDEYSERKQNRGRMGEGLTDQL